jgi:hypothetical protein
VAAIQDHLKLATVKQLEAFLGVVYLYCHFVPEVAKLLRLLAVSLKGSPKALHQWTERDRWRRHLQMPNLLNAKLPYWLTLHRVTSWYSWWMPL